MCCLGETLCNISTLKSISMKILVARVQFSTWNCEAVSTGQVDPLLTQFANDVWFGLNSHKNTQKITYSLSICPDKYMRCH